MKKTTNNKLTIAVMFMTGLIITSSVYAWGGYKGKRGWHGGPMISEYRLKVFSEFDTNNDKVISKAEFEKGKKAREDRLKEYNFLTEGFFEMPDFDFFDEDKDGKITLEEFGPRRAPFRGDFQNKMFSNFDTNNDKFISKKEFEEGMKIRNKQLNLAGYNAKEFPFIASFDDFDENKDGKISVDEFSFANDKFMGRCGSGRFSHRSSAHHRSPAHRWR